MASSWGTSWKYTRASSWSASWAETWLTTWGGTPQTEAWGFSWGQAVAGPMPVGTVPVRYLVGTIPNVVPVVTVGIWAIGVVSVREFVGPANVVPVREVTTETPHVKVVKV